MKTMVMLSNKRYVMFLGMGEEEKAKQIRKEDPRFKFARIQEVIQARPSEIVAYHTYDRLS